MPFSAPGVYYSAPKPYKALAGQKLVPRFSFPVRGVALEASRKAQSPPFEIQTRTCKRAACGLVVPPCHRAKPIHLPSQTTVATRGRLPAFSIFELELELIQTQMTQKPMLRAEVYARALRASQNRKEDSV